MRCIVAAQGCSGSKFSKQEHLVTVNHIDMLCFNLCYKALVHTPLPVVLAQNTKNMMFNYVLCKLFVYCFSHFLLDFKRMVQWVRSS